MNYKNKSQETMQLITTRILARLHGESAVQAWEGYSHVNIFLNLVVIVYNGISSEGGRPYWGDEVSIVRIMMPTSNEMLPVRMEVLVRARKV